MANDGGSPIGRRIHVTGNSSSGKSTLGLQLSRMLGTPFVELDALNWKPNWVGLNETNPEELERRICEATAGDSWVVAGSYTRFSQRNFWDRAQTVIWLDLPAPLLLLRMLRRSWRRWRTKELLWGTNHEPFWPQFKVWAKQDSLVWWIVTQHARKRHNMFTYIADPQWAHIRFVRLTSTLEVEALLQSVQRETSEVVTDGQTPSQSRGWVPQTNQLYPCR